MANYFLQDLLSIRGLREDEATRLVQNEKGHVEHAQHAVETREKERVEYAQWCVNREDTLYGGVVRKMVPVREVLDLRTEVSLLREGQLVRETKVHEARQTLETARLALVAAQAAQQLAARNLQKIEEHRDLWIEEWEKEQSSVLEREVEDLHAHRVEFGDDEEDDEGEESYAGEGMKDDL